MNIKLHNIAPTYLDDRDFSGSEIWEVEQEFAQPEKVHISAPSGTGKTSLALFMYGVRNTYKGQIHLNGHEAKSTSIKEWSAIRQKQLSIIFQDLRLFEMHTGWENILVKAELTNHTGRAELETMAERLQMGPVLDKPCKQMSQGERQRVAILRALAQPFDWLIIDEPFSHLDEKNIAAAVALLHEKLEAEQAGLLALQLGPDNYFEYDKTLRL